MKSVKYLVIAAVIAGGGYWLLKRKRGPVEEEGPMFRTSKVERKALRLTVSGSGVLEPLTTVDVKGNVAGEITQLLVDTGDEVKAGQLIATVDTTESQSSYEQAEADVAAANARVDEARANRELQGVSTPLRISVAEESLKAAIARQEQARQNVEIERRTSAAQIAQSEQSLEAAKSRLTSAERSAAAQPSLTQAGIRQAEANLRSAEEALKELKEASQPRARKQAEASHRQAVVSLENAKLQLGRQQELLAKGFVARQSVDDAQAAVDSAQASVDNAKASLDALDAEQRAEIRTAEATVAQRKAALDAAKTNAVQDDLADQEVESSRAAVKQAEAALALAKANAQQVKVLEAELETATTAVAQARENLKLAEADKLQVQVRAHQIAAAEAQTVRSRAQLDNAVKAVHDTTIYAPRDGVVVEKFVEEGSIITSGRSSIAGGTNIVTIADITQMFVLAEVDEVDVGSVRAGQEVDLTVETFPEENLSGTVTKVYPKGIDVQNVTIFQVKIALDFTDPRLRPGMTAEAVIVVREKRDVLVVPNTAVSEHGGKKSVQVISAGGQPVDREVTTGLASFEETEITSGLKEGEEIITLVARLPEEGPMGGKGGSKDGKGEDAQRKMRRMMRTMRK